MTYRQTKRDRAWLVVLDALTRGQDLTITEVAVVANVSDQTAGAVLQVAEEAGYLSRHKPGAQNWRVDIGPLADVDDDGYRRAIRTLIREAKNFE